MVYDADNRLKIFSQAGKVVVEYGYAADGSRLWKRTDQSATNVQVWIGNIYEEKGGKVLFHVFAGGQQVCTFETNSALYGGSDTNRVAYYYHEDNLNSSSTLSGSGGSQLEVDAYYPFGRALTASPQASFQVSRRFTGQVFDAESGLYYYGSGPYGRYYDPELGRFIQADDRISDLSNPQSYNRYSYCVNDPLRYTDPSGHQDAEPEVRMDIEVRPEPVSYPRGTMPEAEEEREIHSLLRSNSKAETIGPITESKPQTEEQIKAGIARSAKEITDATAPKVAGQGGRLGNQATRDQVADVAGKLNEHGWEITGGGGQKPEEYIPGPGNARKGSSYPDITAEKNGQTLRVNTIDTRANGETPSTREANNATRIRAQKPDDKLILIPKPKE